MSNIHRKCPHCLSSEGQAKEDDFIICEKCSKTYLYDDSQDDDSSFGELPLNFDRSFDESDDGPDPHRRNAFSDSEDDDPIHNRRNVFSDSEDDPVILANKPSVLKRKGQGQGQRQGTETGTGTGTGMGMGMGKGKKKEKEKGKAKAKAKAKAKTAIRAKQPNIFNDISPDTNAKKRPASKTIDMAFSEDDDDDLDYARTSKESVNGKRKKTYPLSTESSEEEEENTIAFDKNGRIKEMKPKARSAKSEPLKQFSPFLQFNKKMRAKIAKESEKDEAPGVKLSQLVAEAWRNMSSEDKHEFNQELAREKLSLIHTVRKKPRPAGNGYIVYSKENMPALKLQHPDVKQMRQLSSIMGSNWKALSERERQAYTDKAKKEKDDWIRDNPEDHQQYLDKMASKIRATKRARREEKERAKSST